MNWVCCVYPKNNGPRWIEIENWSTSQIIFVVIKRFRNTENLSGCGYSICYLIECFNELLNKNFDQMLMIVLKRKENWREKESIGLEDKLSISKTRTKLEKSYVCDRYMFILRKVIEYETWNDKLASCRFFIVFEISLIRRYVSRRGLKKNRPGS